MIIIHTDGSNAHNGKPYSYGGYGFVIEYAELLHEGGGSMHPDLVTPVTNNRAELSAILASLTVLCEIEVKDETIRIVSDSMWCVECAKGRWKRKTNKDLWNQFVTIKHRLRLKKNKLEFVWIRGHAGHNMNERADVLAGSYKDRAKPSQEAIMEYEIRFSNG